MAPPQQRPLPPLSTPPQVCRRSRDFRFHPVRTPKSMMPLQSGIPQAVSPALPTRLATLAALVGSRAMDASSDSVRSCRSPLAAKLPTQMGKQPKGPASIHPSRLMPEALTAPAKHLAPKQPAGHGRSAERRPAQRPAPSPGLSNPASQPAISIARFPNLVPVTSRVSVTHSSCRQQLGSPEGAARDSRLVSQPAETHQVPATSPPAIASTPGCRRCRCRRPAAATPATCATSLATMLNACRCCLQAVQ